VDEADACFEAPRAECTRAILSTACAGGGTKPVVALVGASMREDVATEAVLEGWVGANHVDISAFAGGVPSSLRHR